MTLTTTDQAARRYVPSSNAASPSLVKTDKRKQHNSVTINNNNNSALIPNHSSRVMHSVPIPQSSHNSHMRSQQIRCNITSSSPSVASSNTTNTSNSNLTTSSSFIDCLIRRFKDCFSQDFCSVPVFVVGNLSPGSDGTHLILPPCISLSGQNINRFASPKNLRLMNRIRESCRTVEELDLGANKLNDLVEIYKILQITPNLRILNLSENDLSRATPMAMASNTASSIVAGGATGCSARSYLSPLNVNSPPRRHNSSLFHGPNPAASVSSSPLRPTTVNSLKQPQLRMTEVNLVGASSSSSSSTDAVESASITHSLRSTTRLSAGGPATGVKERRAARASAAISRSVSALSAKDTRATAARYSAGHRNRTTGANKANTISKQLSNSTARTSTTTNDTTTTHQVTQLTNNHMVKESSVRCDDVVMSTAPAPSLPVSSSIIIHATITNTTASNMLNPTSTIAHSSGGSIYFRRIFESIRVLAMNNTRCPWRVVCSILLRMPNLEELHLSLNNYEKIEVDPINFKHYQLKRLYLCNNPKLTNWTELDKILAAFPSLEALSIADCNISQIPDNLDRAREWRKLCGLNIAGWPIKEWPVIERLNQLPSLVDLKCQNLELLNQIEEPENRRHHLIARLPKLIRLNGSEIEEREHAEKAFVRFFIANQHLEKPDRFYELFQVHGEVRPVADVDLSPPNKANVKIVYYLNKDNDDILMSEDFLTKILDQTSMQSQQDHSGNESTVDECGDDEDRQLCNPTDQWNKPQFISKNETQEVVSMTVDLRKSVRNFKMELSSIFNISDPSKLILYYIDHEMVGLMGPELMKHNQKKLWNYNVQNGDQFIVEEA